MLHTTISQIRRLKFGQVEIGAIERAVARINGAKFSAREFRLLKVNALQEGMRKVDPDQSDSISIQLLQRLGPIATAALALSCIDELPRLIVLLRDPVRCFSKIDNDRYQH